MSEPTLPPLDLDSTQIHIARPPNGLALALSTAEPCRAELGCARFEVPPTAASPDAPPATSAEDAPAANSASPTTAQRRNPRCPNTEMPRARRTSGIRHITVANKPAEHPQVSLPAARI